MLKSTAVYSDVKNEILT